MKVIKSILFILMVIYFLSTADEQLIAITISTLGMIILTCFYK